MKLSMKFFGALVISLISLNAFAQTKVCSPKAKSKLFLETKAVGKDEEGHILGEWKFSDGSSDIKNTLNTKFILIATTSLPPELLTINKRILLENRYGVKIKDVKAIQMSFVAIEDADYPLVSYSILYGDKKVYYIISTLDKAEMQSASSENLSELFNKIITPIFYGSVENCI